MTVYQIIVVLFGVASVVVCGWAIIAICRSSVLRRKPLWIFGSLFGFAGLGINWTQPDDVFLEFGIQIPVWQVLYLTQTHEVVAKIMFPVIALIALFESKAPVLVTQEEYVGSSGANDG